MVWDEWQRYRLAADRQALLQQFPGFDFFNPFGRTFVYGVYHSNTGHPYGIRIYLPAGYPDECPTTYVTEPLPLMGYTQPIVAYGTSHEMHTWASDRDGWVKVCTYRPEMWSAAISIVKIVRKAMLWVTAYECHLQDGSPISRFLMDA
ncbi:hypothetical protein AB0L44_23565 [Nonomuraea wenchangensis]|uniref:hypothetical protein n=1 Tax=Nonomuraea wenchangensis TaxID=568860 RepID=UPI0034327A2F